MWTGNGATRELLIMIEEVAATCGAHIALTGGVLYKEGERKDLDIVVYRVRQRPAIRWNEFYSKLADIGIKVTAQHGWVTKAFYKGNPIDFFDPEFRGKSSDMWDGDTYGEGY